MEYVNLDKLVWFQEGPGVRNYQYVDKGIKLINVTNLVNGKLKLHLTNRFISEEEANGKYKHFMCDIGDLVIASSGITYDTLDKKIAFVTEKDLPLCMNTSVIRFKPLDNNVCLDFIYYFLKSKKYKNQISKLMTGSAQLNYGPSHLHKVKIPLYSFDKQLKIAKELKKIDSTILICHNNLENLDNIVKSQFIEMFGDLFYNDNRYNQVKIRDIVKYEQPTKYIVSSEEYNNSYETPVLTAGKNFILGYTKEKNGIFIGSKEKVIIFDDFTCDSKIVNFDFKVKSSAIKILHMKKGVNIDFFYNVLKQHHYNVANHKRHWISTFEIMKIGLPPLKLQNKYASFVEQIDKSKYFGGAEYGIC